MRILAIMGSPKRKGTGYEVVNRIEREMRKRGEVEFDYLFLRDANLGMCRGCFNCIVRGEDTCPMSEERKVLERRMEAADGLILVSPSYVQDVSGTMKNFMDRMAYTHHRPILLDKKVMLVANGGAGQKHVLRGLRNAIGGPEVACELSYLKAEWELSPKVMAKQQRELERQADRFYDALAAGRKAPSFSSYMGFYFFKRISEEVKEEIPADYQFYKDKEEYYYPVKIGAGKRLAAGLLFRVVTFTMRGMAPYKGEARPDKKTENAK